MDRGYGIQPFPRGEVIERFGHHGGGPDSLLWVVFALLLVLLLLVIVSLAVDAYYRSEPVGARLQPATGSLAVLDHRYARGEIDRDAYLQARSDLGGAEAPTLVVPPPPEAPADEPPKTKT
jgi:uncharacterized membrane protein